MFERMVTEEIVCDFCGRGNKHPSVKCAIESFSAWQRVSINGVENKNTSYGSPEYALKYTLHSLLSDIKHLCPKCNELIYDLMSRKHYWVKLVEKSENNGGCF